MAKYIKKHQKLIPRYEKLNRYYRGEHDILQRDKTDGAPNNKIVCNHAKIITDTAIGYFVGNGITYEGLSDTLKQWFDLTDIETVDMDIAKDVSVYGLGFELVHMSEDAVPTPHSHKLSPKNAFVVYDDTVARKPLFCVYYYAMYDMDDRITGYKIHVWTAEEYWIYEASTMFTGGAVLDQGENVFAAVPIIEYSNNEEQQGDFESTISLIDAYNLLTSDRINDKEQFVDAILLLINSMLGDSEEEERQAIARLKESRILEMSEDGDARYLTRTLTESDVEVLRSALEQDIHKFAQIPCLTDEHFAGTASGVALEHKMLGLNTITKTKERYYSKGIKERVKLYNTINGIKGGAAADEVQPVYTRGLPKNDVEVGQMVAQLGGRVPNELLIGQLSFIKDAHKAQQMLEEEEAKEQAQAQQAFGYTENSPLRNDDENN